MIYENHENGHHSATKNLAYIENRNCHPHITNNNYNDSLSPLSQPMNVLLTDFYQFTMAYSYWKLGKHNDEATFELHFRKAPFGGEFTVFAGLSEVISFISSLKFTDEDIAYLKKLLPVAESSFFDYLKSMNGNLLTIYAIQEGNIVFACEPLIRISGPLLLCQLIETIIINLTNYPSLVATNAARFRLAAGWDKTLLEFGLRRAQGPNGELSASRYSYLGGFDGTYNVLAAKSFDIPISGTHSHAYISSFADIKSLEQLNLPSTSNFISRVQTIQKEIFKLWPQHQLDGKINTSELAAFTAYANIFPNNFISLLDTFDTLKSGLPNFLTVAYVLLENGHMPIGVRIDSGDLAYLSREVKRIFRVASSLFKMPFDKLKIIVSNNITEKVLHSLNKKEHEIDIFAIGTHLVTCNTQPALGMVYKLVELNNSPCMKQSQEFDKVSQPLAKDIYRLYSSMGVALADYLDMNTLQPPQKFEKIFCRHLFDETKRCFIIPSEVEQLLKPIWKSGKLITNLNNIELARNKCCKELKGFREDHLREDNPTPFKISYSQRYYEYFHNIWNRLTPVKTIL